MIQLDSRIKPWIDAWVTDLEHLDEGNAQVKVSKVAEDQAQTEHDTNGHNGFAIFVVN